MASQSPRKVLLAVTLLGLSIPALEAGADARPRTRSRPTAEHREPTAVSPWRELLSFLGLASRTPPLNQPQAGCEIDPDGKCRIPVNPPNPPVP